MSVENRPTVMAMDPVFGEGKLCLEMVAKEMHLCGPQLGPFCRQPEPHGFLRRYGNAPSLTFHSFNPGSASTSARQKLPKKRLNFAELR